MDPSAWIVTLLGLGAMAWVVWYFWLYEAPRPAPAAAPSSLSRTNEPTPTMSTEQTETLRIEGMTCDHCVKAVREALEGVDGAIVEDVDVGVARVRFDPARTDRTRLAGAVEDAGYTVVNGHQ